MLNKFASPIDYLVIGHLASDLLPDGSVTLGGTAAYAALTARAVQSRPGILTTVGPETPLQSIQEIPIAGIETDRSTTFENIETPSGRRQFVHHVSTSLQPYMLPEVWRSAGIVHFAPLLDEIDFNLIRLFPNALIGVTPQGWLRSVREDGAVVRSDWLDDAFVLRRADATVLSIEDVGRDEDLVEHLAELADLLVITEGAAGCRLYTRGAHIHISAPAVNEVDSTGAGDIFAAAFFTFLNRTRDPEKSAQIANRLASWSVTRRFMESIPTDDEVYEAVLEFHAGEPMSLPQ